jgi:sporulation protein YlmC with PRC-barrel domain
MKPTGRIKLVSQLLDLPIVDSTGRYSGIVDDVELSGGAGKELRFKALLVGPGAYDRRLPRWAFWLVTRIAGNRIVRVPLARIKSIGSSVELDCTAEMAGLHRSEHRAAAWIPKGGAM